MINIALDEKIIDENGNEITRNKVDIAVKRIRDTWEHSDKRPLWVAFSGGKDSITLLDLVKRAGVPYEAHYNITSIDPPELVQFIKQFKEVSRDHPRDSKGNVITMWNLIPRNGMPPTRRVRYCCQYLKESSGKKRLTCTGVRWAESTRRKKSWNVLNFRGKRSQKKADALGLSYHQLGKLGFGFNYDDIKSVQDEVFDDLGVDLNEKTVALGNDNSEMRQMLEYCVPRAKTVLNPIIDWEDEDVWEYIGNENLDFCNLYAHGGGVQSHV